MQELEKRIYSKFNEIQWLVDYAEELVDNIFGLEGNLLDIGDDSDDEYCEVEMEIREKAEEYKKLFDKTVKQVDIWNDLVNELKEKIKDKDFGENKWKVQELLKKLEFIIETKDLDCVLDWYKCYILNSDIDLLDDLFEYLKK